MEESAESGNFEAKIIEEILRQICKITSKKRKQAEKKDKA